MDCGRVDKLAGHGTPHEAHTHGQRYCPHNVQLVMTEYPGGDNGDRQRDDEPNLFFKIARGSNGDGQPGEN